MPPSSARCLNAAWIRRNVAQLGAHYTSRADIETLVEPVVMQPLRREWDDVHRVVENLLATGSKQPTGKEKPLTASAEKSAFEAGRILMAFWIAWRG